MAPEGSSVARKLTRAVLTATGQRRHPLHPLVQPLSIEPVKTDGQYAKHGSPWNQVTCYEVLKKRPKA